MLRRLFSQFSKNSARRFSTRRRRPAVSGIATRVEGLEARKMLTSVYMVDDTLYVGGTNGSDAAEVSMEDGQVTASITSENGNNETRSYSASSVNEIVFTGYDGNDSFTNQTAIAARAWGHGGNDTLVSGAGNDVLSGDGGNDYLNGGWDADWIYGGDGHNTLVGSYGNDLLSGNNGNDRLYGDDGNDSLYGGRDHDSLYRQNGNDVLEGGSGSDYLNGGAGYDWTYDSYWRNGDEAPRPYAGLTDEQLESIAGAAEYNWRRAGLDTGRMDVEYRIADLHGDAVGWTIGRSDGSAVIFIDNDAAGLGWFVDQTPYTNEEFTAITSALRTAQTSAAATGVDLLTTVSHEIGHAAGIEHTED